MGRYYRLSKKISEDMATEILREVKEIEDVERAEFTDENEKLLIQTGEDKYPDVMGKAVNIFSRVGEGCELSFFGFCVE